MPFLILRYALPASVCLLLAGCGGSGGNTGGGGGGGGTNPTMVTVNFSGAAPIAIATQIGSGTFAAATESSNVVTFSVPNGTLNYAIAWVCFQSQSGSAYTQTQQYVIEATTSDATSYNAGCSQAGPAGTTGTLTMSVDASAFNATSEIPDYLLIEAQDGVDFASTEPDGLVASNISLTAPAGSDRVDIMVYAFSLPGSFVSQYIVAAKSFTGVAVPGALNGGSNVVFSSADATIQEPITYNNAPSGFSPASALVLVTPAGEQYSYLANLEATTAYSALPASIAQSGDQYFLSASTSNVVTSGQSSIVESVSESRNFAGAGPVTVTFPAPWSYSGPTPAALPTLDIDYSGFAGQPNVADEAAIEWSPPSDANTQYFYQLTSTSNYQDGSATVKFPDLSTLTGFIPDPVSGATVNWTAEVLQSTVGPWQPESNNVTGFSVGDNGTYKVP